MVRIKKVEPDSRTVYYLKPGQTLANTKVSERALALIVPKNTFDRFTNHVNEDHKVALMAEREIKRLAALKEASDDMKKTWQDTAKNIQKRRKEELLSRKKKEQAENIKLMKELAAKNALERAEIVKQAKELILYRIPQCRLINKALLSAECLRELQEQTKFQEINRGVEKKLDEEYAKSVMEDVEKFHQEEKVKREAKVKRLKEIKEKMEKRIARNKHDFDKLEASIRKSEIDDLHNMNKEIEDIKRQEFEDTLRKKEKLKKMFQEAIEDKREYEEKLKKEEEFQNETIKIYKEMKESMEKEMKTRAKEAREDKARKIEILAKRIGANAEKKRRASTKQEQRRKEMEEKEVHEKQRQEALQKIEDGKKKKEQARLEMQKQMKLFEEEQEKRKKEEMDLKVWETLQRYKKDEFNKEWIAKHREKEMMEKLSYGQLLKKQMAINDAERQREKILADDAVEVKEMINKANEKVLAYGEQVMQESRGVRPTFPIEKTIEQFKRDAGLIPAFNRDANTEEPAKVPKRRRSKRVACAKPPDVLNSFYFA